MAKPIVVSSPLRGDYITNLNKAADVCRYLIAHDYAPIATHLFYMQSELLNDRIESDRKKGILHTFDWIDCVKQIIFVTKKDDTFSDGCQAEFEYAKKHCIPFVTIGWDLENIDKALIDLETIIKEWIVN